MFCSFLNVRHFWLQAYKQFINLNFNREFSILSTERFTECTTTRTIRLFKIFCNLTHTIIIIISGCQNCFTDKPVAITLKSYTKDFWKN